MKKRLPALLLAAAVSLVPVLGSCGTKPADDKSTTAGTQENTQPTTQEESYVFPEIDYGGAEFTVLNPINDWGFYTTLVHESMTGEILDDAIFQRNRLIEEKFNLVIKEVQEPIASTYKKIRTTVQAGEDAFDAMFAPGWSDNAAIGPLAVENMFYNLSEIPEMQLEEIWWNQTITQQAFIGKDKALYFAGNDINILALQGAWVVYFNEKKFEDLNLNRPYDLVKQGKWTLDEFQKLMKAGASLNGDDSFKWNPDGNSVYGYASYDGGGTLAMIYGSGERFIRMNDEGTPEFSLDTPRFFDVADKIAAMLSIEGEYASANDDKTGYYYEPMFSSGRALMVIAEIKAASRAHFKAMEDAYGILPIPKYDEAQEQYYNMQFRQCSVMTIPVTNQEPNKTGAVLDAWAYVSHRDVTPVFYNATISQKSLRNEESIEMLQIIRDSLFFDIGITFGWTSAMNTAIIAAIDKGQTDTASIIEKNKEKVLAEIQKTMDVVQ